MEIERLASRTLKAYGFELTRLASVTENEALADLLRAIGNKPLSFARCNSLGIGTTVARDELARLWTIAGQYDMSLYGLKDYTPERPFRRPNKHQARG
jgi:hypothetical protein